MNSNDDMTTEERSALADDHDRVMAHRRRKYVAGTDDECTECNFPRELCECRDFSAPKEPYDGDDGEVFRGGEADSYEREQMAEWQRLK